MPFIDFLDDASVNVHHLELFYYVAKHGGISAAMRKIPYGIQQPAISGQILQLEKSLGLSLFQRRPFALTPAGRELLAFAEPFFGRIAEVPDRLRSEENMRLRLAAPATILRAHLPELLRLHKRKHPNLKLQLYDANQATAEALLQKHEIDLAITELEGKPAAGLQYTTLFKLPLVLVVPRSLKARTAGELWRKGRPSEPLIALPQVEVITKQFQAGLRRLSVEWLTAVEVTAIDLIPIYVSLGFGIGVSVEVPGRKFGTGLKTLPLPKFPPLVVAAVSHSNLSASNAEFLGQIKRRALEIQ
jgi:DNA-binding transcriptional LysR family regulator